MKQNSMSRFDIRNSKVDVIETGGNEEKIKSDDEAEKRDQVKPLDKKETIFGSSNLFIKSKLNFRRSTLSDLEKKKSDFNKKGSRNATLLSADLLQQATNPGKIKFKHIK